ncbi:VanZ family protein, partial [Gottfriedia acidiceleris]
PLGCIVYYYFYRTMKVSICILVSILLVIHIEFIQKKYVVGSFDIDDILLNSLGIYLGIKILVGEGNKISKNLLEKSD